MLQEKELYWLAGLLEGEGYFQTKKKTSPLIALEMTDEDIMKRVCSLIGTSYCKPKVRKPTHKQSFKTTLKGAKAIDLMKQILPIMGERRAQRIRECIDSYTLAPKGLITLSQKEEIINRFKNGEKPKDIAKDYPISHWRIYQLVR